MFRNRLYYRVKPLVPWSVRMGLRRWFATRQRHRITGVWPMLPGSEKPPADWPGWPDGKQFAFVLTHDVEGIEGLQKVRQLAELEMSLGFRSSFNFIPEGDYRVPDELRAWLTGNGFEVGVHDLHHDGKLFQSRRAFGARAARINHYLKTWGAAGFRAGFMLNKLDWLHDLNIQYDCSTFDTDPFEPQPEGRGTIFPFWVTRNQKAESREQKSEIPANGERGLKAESRKQNTGTDLKAEPEPCSSEFQLSAFSSQRFGYAELPYTLPQDSTLFLLLREGSIDLWKRKLDWVAKHGGLALLDTHPDYMNWSNVGKKSSEYPLAFYEQFLLYVRSKYEGLIWHALPRDVARLVRDSAKNGMAPKSGPTARPRTAARKPKIWVDLDNTPHVPFFEPILEELAARGFPLLVTARDAFQVCELADKKGLSYTKVGRHHGKNPLMKAGGLAYRSLQLSPLVLRERPALAISHGARSQLLLCNWLRIPAVLLEDYEYSRFPLMMRPSWVMAPTVVPDHVLPCRNGQIRKYTGIKEDVYVWKLQPDPALLGELGLKESDLVVTVRPPATEAHYHNPESEILFERFMERACRRSDVRIVLLPRNHKQGEFIRSRWPAWFKGDKTVIPRAALDGLNLMWHSDLVVSGGGTMNREAAALGVPVYSIFRGTIGAVDRQLGEEGRLVLIESIEDVDQKIRIEKRPRTALAEVTTKRTLHEIVDAIQEIAEAGKR